MANEDKKDFNAMLHDSKDMPNFRPLPTRKALRNMAEAECTLPHQSTMTR